MEDVNIKIPAEYLDISPIADKDFHNAMSILVEEPMFRQVVGMVLPGYKYSDLKRMLLSLNSKHEFQIKVMKPYIEGLLAKTTTGLTESGREQLDKETPYLYITNHRDIVLDSAQLGYLLLKDGLPSCEIAIGNNLLIYDWINKLVRLNKSFIVKRNLGRIQTLAAAIQLSGYMHFAITQKKSSIWLAQREGRCKDSNDRTQESLVKMLTYGNREKSFVESLKEMNIAPVAISYEYDPNDYAKLYPVIESGQADVVYGSRFMENTEYFYFRSLAANKLLTFLTNVLYHTKLTDMETCYKLFKVADVREIPLHSRRFELEPELTTKLLKRGYKIVEIPISYNGRSYDEGKKIKPRDGFIALWTLFKYRFVD